VSGSVVRRILAALLVLGPVTIVADHAGAGDITIFVLAAAALIPLAWLIGEATEQAARHTGPGIGGFLNATFGNAPELIIALFAVNDGLFEVVRGSLTGSVVGNLLLVLGFSLYAGGRGWLDRPSSLTSLGLVALATLLFLIPYVPGQDGDPNRHELAVISIIPSVILLAAYLVVVTISLRRHHQMNVPDDLAKHRGGWSFSASLAVLGVATVVTALVAEALVGSIQAFADSVGLSEFFVAAVIVAIVGNAAEHGGAVVVAARGQLQLAAEIALSSSAQVAVFLIPAVALLSWFLQPLSLAFRTVEMAALAFSVVFAALLLWGGRSSRWRGALLVAAYVGVAIVFYAAGDRPSG
jgi:Ca2+:H+ antiporter